VKSRFLLNFLQFVEWPPSSFVDRNQPFVIAIIGDTPIEEGLKSLVANKTIAGRPVVIRSGHDLTEIGSPHVLFFSSIEKKRLSQMLGAIKTNSTLTVGEVSDFLQQGGMINFYVFGNNVRFELNTESAQVAGLKFSAQLQLLVRGYRKNP
jgi:hypothetical protein